MGTLPHWTRFYDSWVDPLEPVPDRTYADLLNAAFADYADRPAAFFSGRPMQFHELGELSARFAAFLADSGCVKGDVVGICLPNLPQHLVVHAGIARSGCVATGISPLLSPSELALQLNDSGAKVLVIMDAFFEQKFFRIRDEVPGLEVIAVTNAADWLPFYLRIGGRLLKKVPVGTVQPVPGKTVRWFRDIVREYRPEMPAVEICPDDLCLIQYTGGTTGLPKGAELTHRNLVSNLHYCTRWLGIRNGLDVVCSAFPLFHLAGLIFSMGALACGAAQVLIPNPRDTGLLIKEMRRHRPDGMANVPALYQMLLQDPQFRQLDFEKCRMFLSGAAPLAADFIRSFESLVGNGKLVEVYGMTEASPLITMNPVQGVKKVGSVGVPIPSTHVKIVDLDNGATELKPGEKGEVLVSGPQVMHGYRNKPDETAIAVRDTGGERWLHTGDIGWMDTDGYLYLVDRAKDMLIVGGYKVFSREVEEVLYRHEAVAFCAIVGVPDPNRSGSQIVKLVVQPSPAGASRDREALRKELVDYCHQNMAPYKVPKIVEVVDQIPLTAVGKVDKKVLRTEG